MNNHIVGTIGCLLITLLMLGTTIQFTTTGECKGATKDSASWVLMVYLNGDNNISQAQGQLLNSIRLAGASDQVHIAILIDQNAVNDTKLYYLNGTTLQQQTWPSESSMDDPATIVDFYTTVQNDNPGSHYALFISSNKGSGWQGVCWDDHGRGQMITMPELLSAFNQITNNGADKIDVLGIETCMTGNTEVAYQVNSCVNYFVAYPECAMIGEYPYVTSFTDLKNHPLLTPEEFAVDIVNNFVPHDYPQDRMKTTLAATNLSALPSLGTQISALGQYFIDHLSLYKSQITTALGETRVYAKLWYIDYYVDFYDFLDHLNISDSGYTTLKDNIETIMDAAVIANMHLPDDPAHGLSIYFPRRASDYNKSLRYHTLPSPYEATLFAQNTQWNEFLRSYLGIVNNTAPATPTITGPTHGKIGVLHNYTVITTDPEDHSVSYFIDWGDGTNSSWTGLSASGVEIVVGHTWSTKGTYSVRVKAKDELGAETGWGILSVKMPVIPMKSRIILIGKITSLDKDAYGNFRFLPVKLLEINRIAGQNHTIDVLNGTYGEYPCCGYLPRDYFKGIVTKNMIFGVWNVPT